MKQRRPRRAGESLATLIVVVLALSVLAVWCILKGRGELHDPPVNFCPSVQDSELNDEVAQEAEDTVEKDMSDLRE